MMTRRSLTSAGFSALLVVGLLSGCNDQSPDALVASARQYLAKNDRPAAIVQLRAALQANPDLAAARYLLGKALLDNGDFAGAQKELRRAKALGYLPDEVIPPLAESMLMQGDFKRLTLDFGQSAKSDLTSPESRAALLTTLGKAYAALGDENASKAAFDSAIAAKPDYGPARAAQATTAAQGGDATRALSMLDETLAKSPKLPDAWQLKGDLLQSQGKAAEALAAYRSALDANPKYLPAYVSIVSLLVRQGKLDEASKELDALRKLAPKHPQTLQLEAVIAYMKGDTVRARDAIQQVLRVLPNDPAALLIAGAVAYDLKAYAQAESALTGVLQMFPRDPAARRLLAQTYLRQGQPRRAKDVLDPILQDGKADSDTLTLAGEVYAQVGEAAKAATYFEKATALDPKNPSKRTALALAHIAKGESSRGMEELQAIAADDPGIRAQLAIVAASARQGNFDNALAVVDAIEKKQPDKPLAYNVRGSVLLLKGDVAGARKSFEKAVAIDPSYYPAAEVLARLDLIDKKPEDAKRRFEAVLAKDPNNVKALLALAGLRAQSGASADEVAALIGKAVTAKPTDPEPRIALISHWLSSKQPKKAVNAAQDALAAMPDSPEILDAAGRAYVGAGDTNQALQTYAKLVQLRPESPLPFMRMAEIHIANNDSSAARDSLRKALAIKPDLLEARSELVMLDIRSGKTAEALAMAREIQKQRPDESVGYVLEGAVHASNNAWADAVMAYRAGLKRSDSSDVAIYLYTALADGGKVQDADNFAAKWIKDHPKDPALRRYLAQFALAKKDYASAARQYKALLETAPNDVVLLNNVAWASGQIKDPKAIEYAEKASKLAPDNPAVLDTLGTLLVEKGDSARGVETLQKATTIAPNSPGIRLNLARALMKSGQKDAARKELDKLAKLGDKFPEQGEVKKLMQAL
jgi:putative PEP-CTERM system TPR-repeat lipoprotein